MKKNRSALFLDRDGVINRMIRYETGWDSPQSPRDVALVPGIIEIIKWANERSVPVVEISNQPGVAKGKMSEETSTAIQLRVEELLKQNGAKIDAAYICPHQSTDRCECRKPKPGLLLRASREMNIDLKNSVFLGDNESDALAGKSAGCTTVLFLHGEEEPNKFALAKLTNAPDHKVKSLTDVLLILAQHIDL